MDVSALGVSALTGGSSVLTALLGYVVARRRASGKVATTDADALWKEAADLRRAYQSDLAELRKELSTKDARIAVLEARVRELMEALSQRDAKIGHLEAENAQLEARVRELEPLEVRVRELERELQARLEAAKAASKVTAT